MFKFKTFETTEGFELWQADNKVNIFQFSPIVLSAGGECTDTKLGFNTVVGCFVVYADHEEN